MKRPRKSDLVTLIASAAIHAVFCLQAIVAAIKAGGMILNDFCFFLFLPQILFMYFLPPAWPVTSGGVGEPIHVDWLRLVGKLAVAFPASLLYGLVIGALWALVTRKHQNTIPD